MYVRATYDRLRQIGYIFFYVFVIVRTRFVWKTIISKLNNKYFQSSPMYTTRGKLRRVQTLKHFFRKFKKYSPYDIAIIYINLISNHHVFIFKQHI